MTNQPNKKSVWYLSIVYLWLYATFSIIQTNSYKCHLKGFPAKLKIGIWLESIQTVRDKGTRRSNKKNGGKTNYSKTASIRTEKIEISKVNNLNIR